MSARHARQFGGASEPLHVLVPCKSFALGKSRLSRRLKDEDRRAFCEELLARAILNSAALASRPRIAVVTSDRDAVAIARGHGVGTIEDPGMGLNAALEHARAVLRERTEGRGTLLVLPIDLPLASPAAVLQLLDCPGDVVIAPDEKGEGTNVLALRARAISEFRFAYGDRSYSRHQSLAQARGWKTTTLRHSLLAFDVDEPAQYDRWQTYRRSQADVSGRGLAPSAIIDFVRQGCE